MPELCITFPAQDRSLMGVTRCRFIQKSIDHWAARRKERTLNARRASAAIATVMLLARNASFSILVFEHFEDPSGVALRSAPASRTSSERSASLRDVPDTSHPVLLAFQCCRCGLTFCRRISSTKWQHLQSCAIRSPRESEAMLTRRTHEYMSPPTSATLMLVCIRPSAIFL